MKALTIEHGNVGMEKCTLNALRVLELCGRADIPVWCGAWRPILRPPKDASWIHGQDGLGDANFPPPVGKPAPGYAPAELARLARESEEPLTILALAPLTNVALAILLDPDFRKNVKEILFMGGAVRVPGNESPGASFNAAVDPHAAKIVYNSGIPLVQLGLDVCDQVTQRPEDLDAIAEAKTPLSDFLIRMLDFRRNRAIKLITNEKGEVVGQKTGKNESGRRGGGIGLNDLTATGYLLCPDCFQVRHVAMDVETEGLTPGRTVADFDGLWGRKPDCRWAYGVDGPRLVARWVEDMKHYNPVPA